MGNSKTSRYADGKDLYRADAETQRLLRALVRQRPRAAPSSELPSVPQRLLRSVHDAPTLVPASARRLGGEIARLLMQNVNGRKIRDLARRHAVDEGDVARLWARTVFRPSEPVASLPIAGEASG